MIYTVTACGQEIGRGYTPRKALASARAVMWALALNALGRPEAEVSWLDRWAVGMVAELDARNWDRALRARSYR